jgi:hypothetical protein
LYIASHFHRRPPKWPARKSALLSRYDTTLLPFDSGLPLTTSWVAEDPAPGRHWRLIVPGAFRLCAANRTGAHFDMSDSRDSEKTSAACQPSDRDGAVNQVDLFIFAPSTIPLDGDGGRCGSSFASGGKH